MLLLIIQNIKDPSCLFTFLFRDHDHDRCLVFFGPGIRTVCLRKFFPKLTHFVGCLRLLNFFCMVFDLHFGFVLFLQEQIVSEICVDIVHRFIIETLKVQIVSLSEDLHSVGEQFSDGFCVGLQLRHEFLTVFVGEFSSLCDLLEETKDQLEFRTFRHQDPAWDL